jgi:hypothetical protein
MRARDSRSNRRGLTAVAVLVCLVVVTLVSGVLLKVGLAHRDQVRSQEHRLQAEWLAQSGLERALARLAADRGYEGETWKLTHHDLGLAGSPDGEQGPAAVVTIKVELAGSPGASEQKLIKVQADYPPDLPQRSRHSTQILVELNSLKTGASR